MPANHVVVFRVRVVRFVRLRFAGADTDLLSFGFSRRSRRPRIPRFHRRDIPRRAFPASGPPGRSCAAAEVRDEARRSFRARLRA